MLSGIVLPDEYKKSLLTSSHVDDFFGLDDGVWNATETDTNGSVAHDADAPNGVVQLAVTTAINQECYLATNELFRFDRGKPFIAVARVQFTEASTDSANVLFGFVEAAGANTLVDGSAGPKADFDGAVIYKVGGETRWRFMSSEGASQTVTQLDAGAGGASYQTLAIHVNPKSATEVEITPLIDVVGGNNLHECYELNSNPRVPAVKHTRTIGSVGEMALAVGLKNGGGNSETLNVDLIAFAMDR